MSKGNVTVCAQRSNDTTRQWKVGVTGDAGERAAAELWATNWRETLQEQWGDTFPLPGIKDSMQLIAAELKKRGYHVTVETEE